MTSSGSSMHLSRMSGAGNTFVVVDQIDHDHHSQGDPDQIQEICNLGGVATDGLFFLFRNPQGQIEWRFFNSDGSIPEMCGNAARCATLYLIQKHPSSADRVQFQTLRGLVQGQLLSEKPDARGNFQVQVTLPQMKIQHQEIKFEGKNYFWVNSGVPHIVVPAEPDEKLAKKLRAAAEFGPQGANVTFFVGSKAVSYERGVEDFTLACGTGAIATAIYKKAKNPKSNHVEVEMPGGRLQVSWINDSQAVLTGPACFLEELIYEKEIL